MGWRSLAEVAMDLGVTGCSRSVNTSTECKVKYVIFQITMFKRVSSPKNENETFTRPHFVLNLQDFLLWNTKENFSRIVVVP